MQRKGLGSPNVICHHSNTPCCPKWSLWSDIGNSSRDTRSKTWSCAWKETSTQRTLPVKVCPQTEWPVAGACPRLVGGPTFRNEHLTLLPHQQAVCVADSVGRAPEHRQVLRGVHPKSCLVASECRCLPCRRFLSDQFLFVLCLFPHEILESSI